MRVDVVVAAAAFEMASAAGSPSAADERCDPEPDLDGSHLVTHCYGYGHDLTVAQLLAEFTPVDPAEYEARGLVVLNAYGRIGITVGRGYVVEPAGEVYAVTDPDPDRWVAAYQPPLLVRTVVPG